jgi:sugar phosphate isomerase/epimerase
LRLAFSTLACPEWSLEEVVDAAHRYGYDGVELRLIDGGVIDSRTPAAERDRVLRTFSAAGVPIAALDTSIRLAGESGAGDVEAELRSFLELAHQWEAPVLRVFGGEWAPDRSRNQVFQQVAHLLMSVASEAEQLGVTIALETHDAFASASAVADVLELTSSAAVGALWDTHHPYRMGESPERVWELLGSRIMHVHVKDARRSAGSSSEWDLALLGEGDVPVAAALQVLQRHGYNGWVSVEWEKKWHPEIADPELALPQYAELLRQWLGRGT